MTKLRLVVVTVGLLGAVFCLSGCGDNTTPPKPLPDEMVTNPNAR